MGPASDLLLPSGPWGCVCRVSFRGLPGVRGLRRRLRVLHGGPFLGRGDPGGRRPGASGPAAGGGAPRAGLRILTHGHHRGPGPPDRVPARGAAGVHLLAPDRCAAGGGPAGRGAGVFRALRRAVCAPGLLGPSRRPALRRSWRRVRPRCPERSGSAPHCGAPAAGAVDHGAGALDRRPDRHPVGTGGSRGGALHPRATYRSGCAGPAACGPIDAHGQGRGVRRGAEGGGRPGPGGPDPGRLLLHRERQRALAQGR